MKKMYWYKLCPFCNQGRLYIFKRLDTQDLYFHCEECERGYRNPDSVEKDKSFLTLLEDFDSVVATEGDIKKAGWDNLKLTVDYS